MKKIFSGFESSGKSLKLAMTAVDIVYRNSKWYKKTQVARPLWSNMAFHPGFVQWAKSMNVEIAYWKNLEDIIHLSEADIICDEVGNYFDARMWSDLSLDVRRWLTQGAKTGIEFYGGAQDFAQVDKSFRRLVQPGDLIHVTKIVGSARPSKTKPPVRFIWGVCMTQSMNPQGYNEDKKQFDSTGIPSFFFIRKETCMIFDTGQKLERSNPPPYKHLERFCEDTLCGFHRTQHV